MSSIGKVRVGEGDRTGRGGGRGGLVVAGRAKGIDSYMYT